MALRQDGESTRHYGRTGNENPISVYRSQTHLRMLQIVSRFEVSYETLLKIISSGIWRSVVGRVVPDLSKNRSAVVFRASSSADCSTLHMKAPRPF
jgi:hypothetical protein